MGATRATILERFQAYSPDEHVRYAIEVCESGCAPVRIDRRYRDFEDLISRISCREWALNLSLQLPSKHWFSPWAKKSFAAQEAMFVLAFVLTVG